MSYPEVIGLGGRGLFSRG